MKSFSVANRINLGFFVMIVLIGLFALQSYFSVSGVGDSYKKYREASTQSIVINNLVEDLFEARIAAFQYRAEPSAKHLDAVIENVGEIMRDAETVLKTSTDTALTREVTEISRLASEYRDDFLTLSEMADQTGRLDQALLEDGRAARTSLTQISTVALENDDVLLFSHLASAQESLLLGRVYEGQFNNTENPADLERAKKDFQEARASLAKALTTLRVGDILGWEQNVEVVLQDVQTTLDSIDSKLVDLGTNVANMINISDASLDRVGPQIQNSLETWAEAIVAAQNELGPQGQRVVDRAQRNMPISGVVSLALAVVVAFAVGRWITTPISMLTATTNALAKGDTSAKIEGTADQHELGEMARALQVFRDARIEQDRIAEERQKSRLDHEAAMIILSGVLSDLAGGHLDARITDQLGAEYKALGEDFNKAVSQLESTLSGVVAVSDAIEKNAVTINSASNDLSRRTENQAATLEETAAALDELTASVKSSADRATEVATTVSATRVDAKESGEVVNRAVEAMGKIEKSSQQISQITEVIQDISFQTNLLALNAGVEAARAGEAGRGFAVVASEVRALAQRSSQAAREVSELISTSSNLVTDGTKMVNDAGETLGTFVEKVDHIADLIADIASNATEQASGITEINVGVGQLDQVTQQNAGMVEASNQHCEEMVEQAKSLDDLVSAFKLSAGLVTPKPMRLDSPVNFEADTVIPLQADISSASGHDETVAFKRAAGDDVAWEDF